MTSARTTPSTASDQLSTLERVLLVIPAAGGLVFGIFPLLFQMAFAKFAGASGNDPYIYWLAGAACFGYFLPLLLIIRDGTWAQARLIVAAVLTFNVASLYACAAALIEGFTTPVVYLIFATSILISAICIWLLMRHQTALGSEGEVAPWLVLFTAGIAVVAAGVGLSLLLAPEPIGHLLGFKATDLFLYRQGGAATLGYAVMGALEVRSKRWTEMRLPSIMALVFNGISLIATIIALATGAPVALPLIVLVVTIVTTAGSGLALYRKGQ